MATVVILGQVETTKMGNSKRTLHQHTQIVSHLASLQLAYSQALLSGIHCVLEQHRHHHGASASWNWSQETGDLAHLCEIDIADRFGRVIVNRVGVSIMDDHSTWLDQISVAIDLKTAKKRAHRASDSVFQ